MRDNHSSQMTTITEAGSDSTQTYQVTAGPHDGEEQARNHPPAGITPHSSQQENQGKGTICCPSRIGTAPVETLNKVYQSGIRDQGHKELDFSSELIHSVPWNVQKVKDLKKDHKDHTKSRAEQPNPMVKVCRRPERHVV